MVDTIRVSVETDTAADEFELPTEILELYREEPDETDAQIASDMLLMAFTERAHALAHHSEGEDMDEIEAIESDMMEIFEDRFGVSYADATGHSH
ncbi:DUF7545 family protein [Halodesulfurarchaeum sp.]|uniref:DUF7545 family protein n=1 Tax=Halodesulfurarchaeum sp. TaxID=1980530 RepID=UPI001BC08E03|nr:hypothetical protein [Halodesulfurarchaeum sp.]